MSLIKEIESELASKFDKKHCVLTGSGTTAIYLLLKALELKEEDTVLVPGTCCFAPAYAVKYAGLRLDFCDISLKDGCLTPESLESALNKNPSIKVVIGVHLYGNVMELDPITRICRKRNVFFIEDACQAYGSQYKGSLCGSWGDFSVLSFGHTKVLDAGGTGALLTNNYEAAANVRRKLKELGEYNSAKIISLSKTHKEKYYALKETSKRELQKRALFCKLFEGYKNLFIHNINNKVLPELKHLLDNEDMILRHRVKLGRLYKELLKDCLEVTHLESGHNVIPWRFSCLIENIDIVSLCNEIRKKGIDISTWYPNLASMFVTDYSRELENATILEKQVINMWVDDTKDESYVYKACSILKNLISSMREKEESYHGR